MELRSNVFFGGVVNDKRQLDVCICSAKLAELSALLLAARSNFTKFCDVISWIFLRGVFLLGLTTLCRKTAEIKLLCQVIISMNTHGSKSNPQHGWPLFLFSDLDFCQTIYAISWSPRQNQELPRFIDTWLTIFLKPRAVSKWVFLAKLGKSISEC